MATHQVKATTQISLDSAGIRMSPREFDRIRHVDDRFRYELIKGILVVSRYPVPAERGPNARLGTLLDTYGESCPEGLAFIATLTECYLYVGEDRRRADRVIWIGLGRVPDLEVDVPSIAVEFVSQGKRDFVRDYEEKRKEYLGIGISEYWIIDRFRRSMTVHRRNAEGSTELVIAENETYRTDLLPGFELPLARVFVVADFWKQKPRSRRK